MTKKNYQKPSAEYIAFYSDEEITREISLAEGVAAQNDDEITGGVSGGWSEGSGDGFID